ncbi:hypothetical protein NX059_004616 [Plenodomus lindquistii]|nr:hypothetical protein NX059_004616 [Plenodomus lindquistii]
MEIYSTLPSLKAGQIRLITVHPSSESSPTIVKCSLKTHDLNSSLEFAALSYTWGPPYYNVQELHGPPRNTNFQVECNGKQIGVSENLYNFLQHCASCADMSLRRSLWVDALAINQQDLVERSAQVNIMGDIYKAASQVIIWLGKEDESTKAAFDMIHYFNKMTPTESSELHSYQVQPGHSNKFLALENWKALSRFYSRSWFDRAWIIQEVVFARASTVLCGNYAAAWEDLSALSHYIAVTHWSNFLADAKIFGTSRNVIESWHNRPARLTAAAKTWSLSTHEGLLYALIRARGSSCQDPRDKVYSQLGLGEASIYPDYNLPVAEVYVMAAKYILENSESLLLLTCVEGEEFQQVPGLPSWVPDWSFKENLGLRVTGYRNFKAAKKLPREFKLGTEGSKHILSVRAILLDTITESGKNKVSLRSNLHDSNFWAMVQRLPEVYVNGEPRESVVWRSLMTNRGNLPPENRISYPAPPDLLAPSFRDWILWRYAVAPEEPTKFPPSSPEDGLFPSREVIQGARSKARTDIDYLAELALRASIFDVHYTRANFQRPFRTKQGYFGIGTQCLREGDDVWVVPGCRVPLIFRRVANSSRHRLVGGAYVHGAMDGEVVDGADVEFEMVDIE